MAVIDHPVHEKTRFDDTNRYGCHNKERLMMGYSAPDRRAGTNGYMPTFWMERVKIPHVMSRECRFDMSLKDPWCEGCKHRGSGEAYDARVRAAASVK